MDERKEEPGIQPKSKEHVSSQGGPSNFTLKLIPKPLSSDQPSGNPRRVTLASASDFTGLCECAQAAFNMKSSLYPTFYYRDQDGDQVEISSSRELVAAFQYFLTAPSSEANRLYVDQNSTHPFQAGSSSARTYDDSKTSEHLAPQSGAGAHVPFLGTVDNLAGVLQNAIHSENFLPNFYRILHDQVNQGKQGSDILSSALGLLLSNARSQGSGTLDPIIMNTASRLLHYLGPSANQFIENHRTTVNTALTCLTRVSANPELLPKLRRVVSRCGAGVMFPAIQRYAQALEHGERPNPMTFFAQPASQIMGIMVSEPDVLALVVELAPHFKSLGDVFHRIMSHLTGATAGQTGAGDAISSLYSIASGLATGRNVDPTTGRSEPNAMAHKIAGSLATILPFMTSYVSRVQGGNAQSGQGHNQGEGQGFGNVLNMASSFLSGQNENRSGGKNQDPSNPNAFQNMVSNAASGVLNTVLNNLNTEEDEEEEDQDR